MGCTVSGPTGPKLQPDNNGNNVIEKNPYENGQAQKVVTSLRGDVTSRLDARKERHKQIHLKRNKMMSAAEEMSDKVMDEKERLSLGTRLTSRTTSQNTSRTPSPVPKKHVHFADAKTFGAHVKETPTKSEEQSKIIISLEDETARPEEESQMRVISPVFTDAVEPFGKHLTNPIVTISACSPRDSEQKKFNFDNMPITVS